MASAQREPAHDVYLAEDCTCASLPGDWEERLDPFSEMHWLHEHLGMTSLSQPGTTSSGVFEEEFQMPTWV